MGHGCERLPAAHGVTGDYDLLAASTWLPTVGRHVGLHLGRGGASYVVGQGCAGQPTWDGCRQYVWSSGSGAAR